MANPEKKKNPAAFLRNLFHILNNSEAQSIICWVEAGNGFVIKDLPQFEAQILPKYFKHKKYSSFVRQVTVSRKFSSICIAFTNREIQLFKIVFYTNNFEKGISNFFFNIRLPTQIKRKPEKKKKVAEYHNNQNQESCQNWFDVGKSFLSIFPHVVDTKFDTPQTNAKKTIIISKQRPESGKVEFNPEAVQDLSEEEQYVSKISLKGLTFEDELKQSEKQKSDPSITPHENAIRLSGYQSESQSEKMDSEQMEEQSVSKDESNEPNQVQPANQQVEGNMKKHSQAMLSETTVDSWNGISEALVRQNEMLQRSNSVIREMVLLSQKNKIDFLKHQTKIQENKSNFRHAESGELEGAIRSEAVNEEKQKLGQLQGYLHREVGNLRSIGSQQQNLISTTSIRLGATQEMDYEAGNPFP